MKLFALSAAITALVVGGGHAVAEPESGNGATPDPEQKLVAHQAPASLSLGVVNDMSVGDRRLEAGGRRLVEKTAAGVSTTCYWRLLDTAATPSAPMTSTKEYALAKAFPYRTKSPFGAYVVAGASRNGWNSDSQTRRATAIHYINFSIASTTKGMTSARFFLKPQKYVGKVYLKPNPGAFGSATAYGALSIYGNIKDLSISKRVSQTQAFGKSYTAKDGKVVEQYWSSESMKEVSTAAYITKGRPHR